MRREQASVGVARSARDGVHLQQIIETQRAITAADLDLDAILAVLCARAQQLTGAGGAAVLLATDEETLRYAAGTGSLEPNVGETVPIRGSATGSMFLQNDAVVGELDGCGLGVSLRGGDRAVGVLVVAAAGPETFGEDDALMLGLISVLLSAALSNNAALEARRAHVETLGRFRKIFDGAQIGFLRLDADARVVDGNNAIVEMLGYSAAELGHLGIEGITDPVHLGRHVLLYGEIVGGARDAYDIETRYIRKNGEMLWARARATVLERDAAGAPVFTILMIEDISERKAGELVLDENSQLARIVETQRDIAAAGLDLEAVMRLIAERALLLTRGEGAAVNLMEGDTVVMRAAEGIAASLVGIRRPLAESVTRYAAESGHAILIEDSAIDDRLNATIVAGLGERSHICVPFFSGGRIVGSLSVMSTSETDGLGEDDRRTLELLGVVLSSAVTAAAKFEAKRKEVEVLTQFEVVWEHAPVGIQIIDLAGRITAVNPAMVAMYGYTTAELSSIVVADLIHPDDASRVREQVALLVAGGYESDAIEIAHGLRCGRGDISVISSISLIRDADGRPAFTLGMVEDVTMRNAAEEQLHQSQRIEAIGQLSAGIAHDFNNLLVGVLGYAGLAQSEVEPGSPVAEHLTQIEQTARRAALLTKQLLAFAGRQTLQIREMDLNAFVAETVAMLERLLGEQIQIVTRLDPTLPPLLADATQIHQVLINLALNARDAMPQGGVLTIATEQVTVGSDRLTSAVDLEPGYYLALTVSDTGEGMSAEVKERIFEPFFTTKDVGEGTGLGLPSVYGIVKQSHGDIEVTTEVGKGSTFRIYLPGTEAASAPRAPERRTRILMVEDSEIVRGVLTRVIGDGGYDVVAAEDPEAALELLAREAPFDLLLSDIVLPRMNGVELAARIQELQPSIRVLFMSGYQREHRVDPGLLIAKPFSNDELLAKLESTLTDLATAS
jgi:two-component system, cell cycle sensor histidine kinase and response regulator CckA